MLQSETSRLIEIMMGMQNYEERVITNAFTSLIAILYLCIVVFLMIALEMQGVLKPELVSSFVIIFIVVLIMRALYS